MDLSTCHALLISINLGLNPCFIRCSACQPNLSDLLVHQIWQVGLRTDNSKFQFSTFCNFQYLQFKRCFKAPGITS